MGNKITQPKIIRRFDMDFKSFLKVSTFQVGRASASAPYSVPSSAPAPASVPVPAPAPPPPAPVSRLGDPNIWRDFFLESNCIH